MILSKEKNQDVIAYHDMLETVDSAIRIYKAKPSEALWTAIQEANDSCESLKRKIETHDYTEDDARRERVDKRLKALQ